MTRNDERPLKAGMVDAINETRAGKGRSLREPIGWKARAEAAEKRVEALTVGLEQIIKLDWQWRGSGSEEKLPGRYAQIARAALEAKP